MTPKPTYPSWFVSVFQVSLKVVGESDLMDPGIFLVRNIRAKTIRRSSTKKRKEIIAWLCGICDSSAFVFVLGKGWICNFN